MQTAIEGTGAALAALTRARTAVVVADSNVDALYGDEFARGLEGGSSLRIERIRFPAGENSKTLATYGELLRGLAALELTRTDAVVALGGGVTGDLAGFAAATYMRGVAVIQVPTTLLAMVDSSIGGKTGVDVPEGKNLVGAFHLPAATVRDVGFLSTLPRREMMNGFAEMIKTAVLFDPPLLAELRQLRAAVDEPEGRAALAAAIERCAAWKQRIVDEDFREGGRRKLLNLGHTFGHAIEKVTNFAVAHGEAVAMGMRLVGRGVPEIGEVLDEFGFGRVESLWEGAGETARAAVVQGLLAAIERDKKRSGAMLSLIVPEAVGRPAIREIPISEVDAWLA